MYLSAPRGGEHARGGGEAGRTPTSPRPPGREAVQPVLGERARSALRVSAGWKKRHRALLVLLAAFGDAGERSPAARDLAGRLGVDVPTLDIALQALAARGAIWVVRRPRQLNVYVLRFAGDPIPAEDHERFAAYEIERTRLDRERLDRARARSGANTRVAR